MVDNLLDRRPKEHYAVPASKPSSCVHPSFRTTGNSEVHVYSAKALQIDLDGSRALFSAKGLHGVDPSSTGGRHEGRQDRRREDDYRRSDQRNRPGELECGDVIAG